MKSIKTSPKRWRLNYVITYMDAQKADAFRHFVHDALITVATLRKIDYAIEVESRIFDEIRNNLHTPFQDIVADLAYFRSSTQSLSSVKEFRTIIDNLFLGYDVFLHGEPFDVHSQLQKHLKDYPFPEDYCRPLTYPYVEHHNGKESTLCITEASLENLLREEMGHSGN